MGWTRRVRRWRGLLYLVGCMAGKAIAFAPQATAIPDRPPAPFTGPVTSEDPSKWTQGPIRMLPSSLLRNSSATLRSVHAMRQEGFDRVVFEFDGGQVPRYEFRYMEPGERPGFGGSGRAAPVEGEAFLQVRFYPAQAHRGGQLTVSQTNHMLHFPNLQQLRQLDDSEGYVIWVLGNKSANQFRVLELRNPTRLIVDVKH